MAELNLIIVSRHLLVLKRTPFSGSRDETLPCFVETLLLSLRLRMIAAAAFLFISNSYMQGHLQTATLSRHATSLNFFFLSGDFAFNCSPVADEVLGRAGDVFGKMATVIRSFNTVDIICIDNCLLSNPVLSV